jgi:DNA modification methylase
MSERAPWANRIVGHADVDPRTLEANPLNFRRHPQSQADALLGVLSEVGVVQSVIVNERSGRIVDGHLRVRLAVERSEPAIPVVYVDLDDAEERLILATLDPLTAMAETDADALRELLGRVTAEDGAVSRLVEFLATEHGITPADLVGPAEDPGAQIDRADELRVKWGTERGQLWEIGRHRLLCGDATNADDVARLIGGDRVQGVFTSPPYAEQRRDQYQGVRASAYVAWWSAIQAAIRPHMRDDGSFFLNIKPHVEGAERSLYVMDLVIAMRRDWGWAYVDEFCWLRTGVPKMVKRRFKNGFEPVYQFALDASAFKFRPEAVRHPSESVPVPGGPGIGVTNWAGKQGNAPRGPTASDLQGHQGWIFGGQEYAAGLAYPSNVLKAWTNQESLGHEAAFPPQLPGFFMEAYSDDGDIWVDQFMGSGSTVVAAEQTGRACYGLEIEPKYVAVTLERLAGMGLEPRLL